MQNLPSNSKILSAVPFGANGDKSTIPVGASTTDMNWDTGFPEIFSRLISDNGKYVKREDMNAILYALSNELLFQQWGGAVMYDASVAAAIFGYPQYAKLVYKDADGKLSFIESQVPNNSIIPSASTIDVKTNSAGEYDANGIVRWKTVLSNTSQAVPSINVPILTPMWFDHEVDSVVWLHSIFDYSTDTSKYGWFDAESAPRVYSHLSAEASVGIATTETINGTVVSFVLTGDGHKIIMANGQAKSGSTYLNAVTAADTVFASTGVAWYYVLDTTNQCFRLPRTRYGLQGVKSGGAVGKYDAAGLPQITGTLIGLTTNSNGDHTHTVPCGDGNLSIGSATYTTTQPSWRSGVTPYTSSSNGVHTHTVSGNPTITGDTIYGSSTTVQTPATEMYLYFASGRTNADEYNPGGGGVIDGTLLEPVYQTTLTFGALETKTVYTVKNDCGLYLYASITSTSVLWYANGQPISDVGMQVNLPNANGKIVHIKKGSVITMRTATAGSCTIDIREYALTSIAPQIAMPNYSATPETVTSGWTATQNGYIIWAAANPGIEQLRTTIYVNGVEVNYYQPDGPAGDMKNMFPVSAGDVITYSRPGTGAFSCSFIPCKTVQQSTPPVYCNGSGQSQATGYWWRTYSDGFCEQGGTLASGTTVELPKQFINTTYQVEANGVAVSGKQAGQFTMASTGDWCAKGYIV